MVVLFSIAHRDNQTSQSRGPVIPKEEDAMAQAYALSVDSAIFHEVASLASCTVDELVQRLPTYSWAQVFAAVDRLSRQGTLRLSRASRFGYILSLCSAPPLPGLRETEGARRCVDGAADSILTRM